MSSLIIVIINYCKKLEKTKTVGEKMKVFVSYTFKLILVYKLNISLNFE